MCKWVRKRRPGCNRLVGRITDLRNNQAIVNKTINIALAQSCVMGVDRACALAGQVITNAKGPYLFYRGNVKTKKLTPDGEFSVPTQWKKNCLPAHGTPAGHQQAR